MMTGNEVVDWCQLMPSESHCLLVSLLKEFWVAYWVMLGIIYKMALERRGDCCLSLIHIASCEGRWQQYTALFHSLGLINNSQMC